MYQNKAKLDANKFIAKIDGKDVALHTIYNKLGSEIYVINQGAKIVSIMVPDRDGNFVDVVIGHDSLQEYIDSEEQYFGAICGRYANRIEKGLFTINGKEYKLAINNGPNALHGGLKGFNAVIWTVEEKTENSILLSYLSKDGEEGYPGNLLVKVRYTISDENELIIDYNAKSDADTIINITNHSYFNLSGSGDASIHDHSLQINAKEYLPTDETAIPLAGTTKVEGTAFDFIDAHLIGERIDSNIDQLIWARGYDHSYILDKKDDELSFAARLVSPKTGISMEVYTTEPAVQIYTGNWMSGNMRGKHDQKYPARSAVCLETQHCPNSPNRPDFPSTLLKKDTDFNSTTVFKFGIEK